jgi:DnaK suppressor protein
LADPIAIEKIAIQVFCRWFSEKLPELISRRLTTEVYRIYHDKAVDGWTPGGLPHPPIRRQGGCWIELDLTLVPGLRNAPMKKTEAKEFRNLLVELRARLRGDVSTLADAALGKTRTDAAGDLSSMPIHMADIGTDAFEQEFNLGLLEHDGATLEQIEAALERIEDGVYGVCVECEAKIPKARLQVLPHTAYCVKCADKVTSR